VRCRAAVALTLATLLGRAATARGESCAVAGELEVVPFASRVFPTPRSLRVLLPEGYASPDNHGRRYPVLYLNDGQNLFDVCTATSGSEEWRADETVRELTERGEIPPILVVGIDNAGLRLRGREYLPYVDETLQPPMPDPQGALYPRFLLDEVVPFVESRYRTLPGARNRVLGGSSYGAGAALFTAIHRPQSFGGLLLESPSVYADDDHLLREARAVRRWPSRVYVGTGTVNEPVEDVAKLRAVFEHASLGRDRLRVVIQDGAGHSERWWAQRLPEALRFLFGR
jgi:enterochelin esterase-like enzyme